MRIFILLLALSFTSGCSYVATQAAEQLVKNAEHVALVADSYCEYVAPEDRQDIHNAVNAALAKAESITIIC